MEQHVADLFEVLFDFGDFRAFGGDRRHLDAGFIREGDISIGLHGFGAFQLFGQRVAFAAQQLPLVLRLAHVVGITLVAGQVVTAQAFVEVARGDFLEVGVAIGGRGHPRRDFGLERGE